MLKDVVDFVMSRSGFAPSRREDALREINFAWRELWNADDLPNSIFDVTLKPVDSSHTITCPWYVGTIRAVKLNTRQRVDLNTPRPYYHDDAYAQSPLTWQVMGISPLMTSIINATTLNLSITTAESVQFKAYLKGPTDHASEDYEEVTFAAGVKTARTVKRFSDLTSFVKDTLTRSDLILTGANGENYGMIANCEYEAKNTVVQITDRCITECNICRCFDVLYKLPAPILVNEYSTVPFEEVLMNKTMEWITLPKDGQEQKAMLFGTKSAGLLNNYNNNESSIEHKMDLARNRFPSSYNGYL